jgi:thioredoxin-dependent peroxiredoxin
MEKRSNVITFQGNPLTLVGKEIKVGETAPDFTAVNNELKPVSLKEYGGKVKVISVMPSVDTPVCAAQTRRFNMEAAELENVQIMTLSVDLPFALGRFCASEGIEKAVTLSDYANRDFGTKFGFLIDEIKLLSRGVVVLDKDNKVVYVEYVKEVTDEPNYDAALEAVKKTV